MFSIDIFFLHNLELWHKINITASKDKPEAGDCLTITCNVACEFPFTMKWVYENGDTVVNTTNLTVSKKERYCNNFIAISIIFKPVIPSHEGKYKCISLVDNMNINSNREKEYLLNITGKTMQISIIIINFLFSLLITLIGHYKIYKTHWFEKQ